MAPTLLALKDADAGGLYVFLDEGQRVFNRLGAAPIEAGVGTARAWLAIQAACDLATERAAATPKVRRLQPVV